MRNRGNQSNDDLTAFKDSRTSLREKLASATINPNEFQRKLMRCSLSNCRGTCCYDGASVDESTGKVLQELVNERRFDLEALGLDLPKVVVERSEWKGQIGTKIVSRPFPFRSLVRDYPTHFNETACVFLLDDGRCGLQILSVQDGRHRWYYKPFTCWLQPIKLSDGAIRLYDETTDPNRLPNYDGFVIRTHCGRTETSGHPAAEVLREELEYLGKLFDRDLLAELQSKK